MQEGMSTTRETHAQRATTWLSYGLERLIDRVGTGATRVDGNAFDFDVVIVGSGYGGAVALSELAGRTTGDRPLRICLLERGREYLPGSFPSRFAELAGHVRFSTPRAEQPRGVREGLFDLRIGPDLCALVGNGLGGGSLINAGVMAWPHPSVFGEARWPEAVRSDEELSSRAHELSRRLGAHRAPQELDKGRAMRWLAAGRPFGAAQITIADADGCNPQGVRMQHCLACGDCMTGCNHQAKASLDVTLLVQGRQRGAEIVTGATVLRVGRLHGTGWRLVVVPTDDKLRARQDRPLMLRAARVILAAGAYGSTEILLRSRAAGLPLSPKLGHQFSANGDTVAAVFESRAECNAVADERTPYDQRRVGPTITGIIDLRQGDPATDVVIQDLTVPAALRRLFEETFTTADAIHRLGVADDTIYSAAPQRRDPNAIDPQTIRRSVLLALIGRDGADGRLELVGSTTLSHGDGAATVHWPELRDDARFATHQRTLEGLLRPPDAPAFGGRVLPNPLWRLLPESVEGVLGEVRGPLLTVHPLGGCPMGDDASSGVVDHLGRVFDASSGGAPKDFHKGLLVLDGSIVPTSLGINPALTIATLAQRAIQGLDAAEDPDWCFGAVVSQPEAAVSPPNRRPPLPFPRPIFRVPPPARAPADTMLELTEQMRGELRLRLPEKTGLYRVELTLWFEPIKASSLASADDAQRRLEVDKTRSELRVLSGDTWPLPSKDEEERSVVLKAMLSGSLTLLRHEPSSPSQRRCRALRAWLVNRGLRDVVQWWLGNLSGADEGETAASFEDRTGMAWRLATRAGDVRLLEYDLVVDSIVKARDKSAGRLFLGQLIRGDKRITYECAGNPWQQLGSTHLTCFPLHIAKALRADVLAVHLPYFGRVGVPLAHIVEQQDMPSALADLGSFGLYLLRTLLHVHVWTLRMPDAPPRRTPQRLPGTIGALIAPQVCELVVDKPLPDGTPVLIRLTRYRPPSTLHRHPVLMIHGYSASGTTFAHPAIPSNGLAGYMSERGYDVWVLDLRSSAGLPTARHEWSFEQIGCADIPKAVDQVLRVTGKDTLDIVAHCMGVAMLTLGLCDAQPPDLEDRFAAERHALPGRIHKLVMSQVGPYMAMAPGNVLRAYLMRYLRHYLPIGEYRFRPEGPRSAADAMIDRLLSSLPYPRGEFRRENPFWPPCKRTRWVATRHRIDALYGHTFELSNMTDAGLDRLDDFFGPLNIATVAQVIHFARWSRVTDRTGAAEPGRVLATFKFEMLHLCGKQNGLVDPATVELTARELRGKGRLTSKPPMDKLGHQDSLIGANAVDTFAVIEQFLAEEITP